jgi:hypothetical protein
MTRQRARAYARVMMTLRELGPTKLLPAEQERIRGAADALVFSSSIATDRSARAAFLDIEALCDHLVDSGRWSTKRADELASDLWLCGPGRDESMASAA